MWCSVRDHQSVAASRIDQFGGMSASARPTKITFADMCAHGVRGILVYCADYRIAVAQTAPPARNVTPAMKIAVSHLVISQPLRMRASIV